MWQLDRPNGQAGQPQSAGVRSLALDDGYVITAPVGSYRPNASASMTFTATCGSGVGMPMPITGMQLATAMAFDSIWMRRATA